MIPNGPDRTVRNNPRAAAISLISVALLLAGCNGNQQTRADGRSGTMNSGPNVALLTEVERNHVIGPATAGELNYRVAWQYVGSGRHFKHFSVQNNCVFTLDGMNFLTRIRVEDGNRVWRMQVAEPIEEVLGITFERDRIFVTTGSAILVIDPNTGSQMDKHPLFQIASTSPSLYGEHLIYGSRNGQIVWHSALAGQHWRGYQVSPAVLVPPVVAETFVVGVGNDGTVIVLGASSARQFWSKRLLAPVVSRPTVGDGVVYVAALDQYLWAFDLASGRNLWRYLTPSQLTDSPVLAEDRIYQQVPRQGLFCFEALPEDSPGGRLIWKSPNATGNVVLKRRNELFAWDAAAKRITVVDADRGSLIRTVDVPQAQGLVVAGERDDIYAMAADGRVVRLVQRN